MDDLISRKALLETMVNIEEGYEYYMTEPSCATAYRVVSEQPTVDRWIPCSERLPEEQFKGVLVDTGGIYEIAWRNGVTWHHKDGWFYDSQVIAWMPLPEPYKEGDIDG
jgi:hypothetical protein